MENGEKARVVVIGAGAVGCSVARELSRYDVDITVVDQNPDVGGGASRANSAIIHTGYDATPETLESKLAVAANPMYDLLARQLDVPFERVGAILPAFSEEQAAQLPALLEKARLNRVFDVEYLSAARLMEMEPALNPEVRGGLYIPRESIIDPFLLVVAYAENARQNGVRFVLDCRVIGIRKEGEKVCGVETTRGLFEADYIVNAAGLYNDTIADMVGKADYAVNPRKGQFYILDKGASSAVRHIVLPIPTKLTKGKLICPTIHGNMLVGPTAEDGDDRTDFDTTAEGLASVARDIKQLVPGVQLRETITQFAGLRANRVPEGVRVDFYEDCAGFVNITGVRSTGITISAALGCYVVQQLLEHGLSARQREEFMAERTGIARFSEMTPQQREEAIARDTRYGNIVCRCETVTEAEIVQAIHSPIPARSVDAIKRRLRAGMGRCQGGFCTPRVLEILAQELDIPVSDLRKSDDRSWMVAGPLRGAEDEK